ncbi:MAG TPA: ABC transporter substrate-binding protein [Acidocella sp.]|uniref:MlaC/ttg2D family ABC transporter substrate-binding protein n=1 Tax=Acidocella sp. TaxID=50710 RepID=UPI002B7D39F1|nr:ABC transporter substrate-binding protein [Acidocella sp.]HVE21168.1 ABC transporter substrate-binding protein [Acidocella sp.]
MYFRRFILGTVAAMPLLAAMAGAAHAQAVSADAAKAFIRQSGQQLQGIINGSATQAQKADQLRQLVNQIVAVDQVGDYVLGRYLNVMTPQQHGQFQNLFHQLLSYNITYQIKAYQGVSFIVNSAAQQGNDMVVNTTVTSPGKQPADVGWAVDEIDGSPKIVDVIVAGTSLRITTRNDYSSVIVGHGGQVSALLNAMQGQITRIANAQ